jgi:hypothetical protein
VHYVFFTILNLNNKCSSFFYWIAKSKQQKYQIEILKTVARLSNSFADQAQSIMYSKKRGSGYAAELRLDNTGSGRSTTSCNGATAFELQHWQILLK